ncbi:phosphoadenylyl-sulfate reductase (thioredoxin) Ecym_2602 [Eremothecium cymbalariae DBVPG|uniref:Phosphoadenosine phosphosulphate reductase domain-containing protein n=1 Tax=Eremothecium cymbalariae (strain CBS 270.75 / DBVPG 7215 / KCTC 17166 / NRRL Y-17582) TaxID=931890 RepID=G8JQI2_ERECY|nr:Hypothetical protein Ecym_2602 [Eremothecium cymbalariae DBVPG\
MKSTKIYNLNNDIVVTQDQLDLWNDYLSDEKSPQEILQWSIGTFPHLYQSTAFGLTGLVIIDMLSKILHDDKQMIPLIFIDTLHHFPQTLDLMRKIEAKYYKPRSQQIHIFQPKGVSTEHEFIKQYGDSLWEREEDKYDFLVKVEPAHRAYQTLKVSAVLTGRRKSQGGSRANLQFVEVDEVNRILKINPLANWNFSQVKSYVYKQEVPYNELLDLGYKSIGDYHSTQPVGENEDERSGRWKGKVKSECGLHLPAEHAESLLSSATY